MWRCDSPLPPGVVDDLAAWPNEEQHAPISTGLVYLDDGEHELEFVTLATGAIAGRVEPLLRGERLAVCLVGDDGRAIPTRVARTKQMRRIHPVEPDGTFLLSAAPVGRRRLRIGTRAELERGVARRAIALTVERGGTCRIDETGL